jgi:hypothetical protein
VACTYRQFASPYPVAARLPGTIDAAGGPVDGWIIGYVVGAVVVAAVVVLLLLMIAAARRTAEKAEAIVAGLHAARDGTAGLRDLGTTLKTTERVVAGAVAARAALTPGSHP